MNKKDSQTWRFSEDILDEVLGFLHLLLFEKYPCQACGQCRIARLLMQLGLLERDGAIVVAVKERLVRFRGCAGSED